MKTFRRTVYLFALLALTFAVSVFGPASVQAAKKTGLVKAGGKYYYYQNGAKLKNKWKSAKGDDGKVYRFYFGKKGAANKAPTVFNKAYNVKLFKVGKKKYGFDNLSHLAKPGYYVTSKNELVVIGKKGIYNAKKTKELRRELKPNKKSKGLYSKVIKTFGKPTSELESNSCNEWNATDPFTDVTLIYPYFDVDMTRNDKTKEYIINGIFTSEDHNSSSSDDDYY